MDIVATNILVRKSLHGLHFRTRTDVFFLFFCNHAEWVREAVILDESRKRFRRSLSAMHMLSDNYLKQLSSLLGPCRVDAIEFLEVGDWLITARDDKNLPACCNVCERPGTRYDHIQRKVRHLNFRSKRVFVFLHLPRVQCAEHGVRIVRQSIFDHHFKYSPEFQEFFVREFLSDPSAGSSVARRLAMPTTTMMRIVQSIVSRTSAVPRKAAERATHAIDASEGFGK
jgi:hypothetical protein